MKNLLLLLMLALLTGTVLGQTDAPAPGTGAEEGAEGAEDKEECEEAWLYMEFLKTDIKTKIETVMQETLFNPSQLLDKTVADTMAEVLVIRDSVLDRVKMIRTGDITICRNQNVKQEEFLSELRLDVMTVLLRLIESDAASEEALQEVARLLLSIRTKVNGEITRLIMINNTGRAPPSGGGECPECEFLATMKTKLEEVIDGKEGEGDAEAEAGGEENAEEDSGANFSITMLTMLLMDIDARVGTLYNSILAEVEDEGKREELSTELRQLKAIAGSLDEVLAQMVDDPNNATKIKRLINRDIQKILREVQRLLELCSQRPDCKGTTLCKSCGADKITEIIDKLDEYNATLGSYEEEDARAQIRTDLITYLNSLNEEMTKLLTEQIENAVKTGGEDVADEEASSEDSDEDAEKCTQETLKVIGTVKAPLWMVVNLTLFGETQLVYEMVYSLKVALLELRSREFCRGEERPTPPPETCALQEIEQSSKWIEEIDTIIQENLFKADDPIEARKQALLGFVSLRSLMEERVRDLYKQELACPDEAHQIKHIYSETLTECIQEMMNPRYKLPKNRAERVQCIKQLRVDIEQRRGELLFVQIQDRIRAVTVNQVDNGK